MVWLPNDKTFDGSEKNEITWLTSWEITLSLSHTHTHTDPCFHPPSVSVTAHKNREKIGKWIYEITERISKRSSGLISPQSNIRCQRNRWQDINFQDVRNLGRSSRQVISGWLQLFVCVSVFPAHFQHLTDISVTYGCLRSCFTFLLTQRNAGDTAATMRSKTGVKAEDLASNMWSSCSP